MEQRSTNDGGSAQLARALDILELLARSGTPVPLTEISTKVGGAKATVHRLLGTLQARGYVSQDSRSAGYSAGVRCFELGSLWAHNLDLRATAAPHLRQLNQATGETAHLAVYDHGDVVYVEKLECRYPVVALSPLGRRCTSTCVATGRVLLAFQPTAEIRDVLAKPLPRFTERTVTDPAEITEILAEVRRRGYGVNRESLREGVCGLAAPIRDHTGAVIAAVGVCLPVQRFGEDRFEMLRDETTRAATEISAALGSMAAAPDGG